MQINVTKSFMPPIEEYYEYLKKIWASGQLTNQGPLLREFEDKVREHLGVEYFHFVSNGTLALQVAIESMDIEEGEIITTPFSYVATISSILWQHCTPVFVDIDPETLCIDAAKIEQAVTKKTKAIMPVHVFGNACDVEAIERISQRHNLKVVYDGAHAFGVHYKGHSLLTWGDMSICSFHATKLFHTIEGGCIITNKKELSNRIDLVKRFGHRGDEHFCLGLNAKASEFQAAMGLCNLKYVEEVISRREKLITLYDSLLAGRFQRPVMNENIKYNSAYFPIIFDSEDQAIRIIAKLAEEKIVPRRYFYPSLNTLPYIKSYQNCPISEDISKRILCLPLSSELSQQSVGRVCKILIEECLKKISKQ